MNKSERFKKYSISVGSSVPLVGVASSSLSVSGTAAILNLLREWCPRSVKHGRYPSCRGKSGASKIFVNNCDVVKPSTSFEKALSAQIKADVKDSAPGAFVVSLACVAPRNSKILLENSLVFVPAK